MIKLLKTKKDNMPDLFMYFLSIIIGVLCMISGYKTLKKDKEDSVTLINTRLIITGLILILIGLLGSISLLS